MIVLKALVAMLIPYYDISYPYTILRDYRIAIFGAKIKQPRKSHIKKKPKAQADFLKLT